MGLKPLQLFAVAGPGLEKLLQDELKEIGISKCRIEDGGVSFSGDLHSLRKANLNLRTASRILLRVARFHASAFHELERNAKRVYWNEFVPPGGRVTLRVTCRKSKLYHSDAVAERIARVLSEATGARVFTPAADPDTGIVIPAKAGIHGRENMDSDFRRNDNTDSQLFVVRLFHDECSISADSSGAHLHMRGYREAIAKAPLRETLATALIRASGWSGNTPLIDPMCGAGTIAIEAALVARRIPSGLSRADREPRAFSFERWPDHDAAAWQEEVDSARSQILQRAPARILASDRDAGAITASLANAGRAGVADDIEVEQGSVSGISRPAESGGGFLLCNPPYGKRVGEEAGLRDLYARFGQVLREEFAGWRLTMLSGNRTLVRQMRLDFHPVANTSNGGIPVEIISADII